LLPAPLVNGVVLGAIVGGTMLYIAVQHILRANSMISIVTH
jgi:hypothetical protein